MDDLISRQDAIEAIEMLLEQSEDDVLDTTWNNAIRGAVNAVKHHTKFAQPEVRAQISSADCISRQDAIDVAKQHWYKPDIAKALEALPSAQPDLSDDGTLMMTVPHGILSDVKRVLVDEVGTKFCKTMYQDEPEHDGWIPTKIAKPPKAGQYLVTKQQKTGACQIATAHYNPSFDEWSGNGNFTKVLAWQQLPSPYTQE